MPTGRTNKIEVDLNLLQKENLEKLEKFNKDFEKTTNQLMTMVGSWSDQVAGAQGMSGPGKEGPDASTPSKVAQVISGSPPARMGGINTGGIGGFYNGPGGVVGGGFGGGGYGGGGGPSMAPGPNGPMGVGIGPSFEQQYIRAQRRVGQIPVGLRETLGYFREGGISGNAAMDDEGYALDDTGRRIVESVDEEGNPVYQRAGLYKTRLRAGEVNTFMFQSSAIRANLTRGMGHLTNLYASVAAPTMLGQQLGASREGWLGTSFMSPAFKKGVSEFFHTGIESYFGFNPNYSTKQAQEARQTLQSYGYSGGTSNWMADRIKALQIHQGIDAASAMSILDPIMRFGGPESFNQLQEVLKDIPAAAHAAKMNLSEFTKALIESANQVAQATGMTPGGATRALNAFSTTTGLNPTRGVDLLSNPQNLMMAAGMTGKSITSLMEGNNRMAPRMAFGLRMFQNATGVPVDELLKMKKADRPRYESIMNGVYMMYENNPQIFGGMSPLEIEHAVTAAGGSEQDLLRHTRISEQIQAATGTHRAKTIETLLHQWGDHNQVLHEFEQAMAKPHKGKSANQIAEGILAGRQNLNARKASQKVMIELSHDAKKWFSLVHPDKAHTNTAHDFSQLAIAEGRGHIAEVTSYLRGH